LVYGADLPKFDFTVDLFAIGPNLLYVVVTARPYVGVKELTRAVCGGQAPFLEVLRLYPAFEDQASGGVECS
jgi:hypothetical protein